MTVVMEPKRLQLQLSVFKSSRYQATSSETRGTSSSNSGERGRERPPSSILLRVSMHQNDSIFSPHSPCKNSPKCIMWIFKIPKFLRGNTTDPCGGKEVTSPPALTIAWLFNFWPHAGRMCLPPSAKLARLRLSAKKIARPRC